MNEWKRYPENKPERDILALVRLGNFYYSPKIATYDPFIDCWVVYIGNESLPLKISHYLEIPHCED